VQNRFDALSSRIAEAHTEDPVEKGVAEIDALVSKTNKLVAGLRFVFGTNVLI
jgi:hypothetical protein